ncbi:hypothetical protein [Nocardia sp. NPDC004722]
MSRNQGLYLLIGTCAAVILAAATLSLLHPHPQSPGATSVVPGVDHFLGPGGPTPAGAGAQTAAEQALTAVFTWQPVTDTSTGEGLERAKPWLTGQLLAAADTPDDSGGREIPRWASWREAADVITATAQASELTTQPDGTALVQIELTQTLLHRDGSSTRYRRMNIAATTALTPAGWRLSAFAVHANP